MGRRKRWDVRWARRVPVFLLTWALLTPVVAHAQGTPDGQSDHPVVHALLQAMYGDDYFIARTTPGTVDPVGDPATFGGDARADMRDILYAEWLVVEDPNVSFFEFLCEEGGIDFAIDAVCPLDLALFQASREFIFVYALAGGVVDADSFLQFVFAWAEPAIGPYEGAPNDITTGRTRSKEIWQPAPGAGLQGGETVWDGSGFGFDPEHQAVVGVYGEGMVGLFIPRSEFVAQCLNVAVSLVTQPGVGDIAELPDQPNGAVTSTPPEPAPRDEDANPTPSEDPIGEAPGEPAVTEEPATETAGPATDVAVDLEDAGGTPWGWGLLAAVLLIAGLGGMTLARRRPQPPPTGPCAEEKRRWDEALGRSESANRARRTAQEALHEIELQQGPIRVELDNAARVAPRPGEAGYEEAIEHHQARVDGLQQQFDALESLRVQAAAALDDAEAGFRAADDAETAARTAYQDCIASSRESATTAPARVTPAPAVTGPEAVAPTVIDTRSGGDTTTAGTPAPVTSTTSRASDGCTPGWQPDQTGPARTVLGDTVTITLDHSTRRFRQWLDAHGTLTDGDIDDESQWEPASGTFPVRHMEKWEGRKADVLFRTDQRAYQVEFTISIDRSEQFPSCLRWWDCDPEGNLVPTDRVKLGPRETVAGTAVPLIIRGRADHATELATKLSQAYQTVTAARQGEREIENWETQNCF